MYDASMGGDFAGTNGGISETRKGAALALGAYFMWGTFPAYFKMMSVVPPLEVLAHRIIWSAAFLALFVIVTGEVAKLRATFRDRKALMVLVCTTLLISTNWFVFIYAVTIGKVLESSLGYFINPLVSILLASVFLRERLTGRQTISIALAAAGVVIQTIIVGSLPVISLILAFTFGLYGLIRKAAHVPAVTGLAVETMLTSPLALVYLGYLMVSGKAVFLAGSSGTSALLLTTGVITATPLIFYGGALNRLRLSTLGIMQYIVPTAHFIWAVFVFGEKFTVAHMISFGFIWAGLVLYTSESLGVMKLKPATQAAGQVD